MNTIQDLFRAGMKRDIPELSCREGLWLNLGGGGQLGCGHVLDLPEWNANTMPIPYKDNSVACINAFHFLEHVSAPITVLRECERVLLPGGVMNIVVPYYNSQLQAHDLTHKNFFTEETWKNLFKPTAMRFDREVDWKFEIGLNIIIGIVERNLCLMTQLTKVQ